MTSVEELQSEVVQFAHDRNWPRFHDPKNLSMALASEVGELNAILRWVSNADSDAALRNDEIRRRFQFETADVAILLLLLCARTGIDLASTVREKLVVNGVQYPIVESRDRPERPDASRTITQTS